MKDVEFHVSPEGTHFRPATSNTEVLKDFGEACRKAVVEAASSGRPVFIDVVIYSKVGAKAWGGDAAVEVYEDDPDASVHERIVVRADDQGRIA